MQLDLCKLRLCVMLNLKHFLLQALFFSLKMPWLAPCDTSDTPFFGVSLI